MEHAAATVPGIAGDLAEIARRKGPFLSVYLTTERTVEHPAQRAEARWKALRRAVHDAGAPGTALDTVARLVPHAHLEGAALGIVLASDGGEFEDYDGEPLAADMAVWGQAPVLTPAIAWRQQEPPYVMALVDREGADLLAVSRDRPLEDTTVGAVQWPIKKVRGGGWAHWRFEHRVEENWARNERLVAREIERMVDRVKPRVVLLAGDEEAIGILRPMLPERVNGIVQRIPGSRAAEGASDELGDDARRWVRSAAASATVDGLEALRTRLAHGLAVEGVAATLAALREARVEVLLVHDPRLSAEEGAADEGDGGTDGAAPRTAWFAVDAPYECARDRADLDGLGLGELAEASLVDVAVRAALVSGGSVLLVPAHGGPAEGLGALLRWSEDTDASAG